MPSTDPIASFSTTTGAISIHSTNAATWIPYTEWQLKVVYTSTYVKLEDSDRTAEDEFTLIVKASCADNVITLGTPLQDDIEYYVGQGDDDLQIDYTTSIATNACPLDAKLYIKNDLT